jgi:hypothetical protein
MRWMAAFFLFFVLSYDLSWAQGCDHVDMDWLSRQAPLSEDAKIVYKKVQGELCEVVVALDGNLVPLYAGKDFLLVGKLFKDKKFVTGETMGGLEDLARDEREKADGKEALEKEKRKRFFQKNLEVLEDLVLFSFKPGRADRVLYLVTDPDCSHCKKLMSNLEILAMENHLEIKVVVFPVLGPESRSMAVQAICENVSHETYGQIQFVPDTPGCRRADLLLKKTMSFFSNAGLSFVPVVISGDGSWVVEGNDLTQVKDHLNIP